MSSVGRGPWYRLHGLARMDMRAACCLELSTVLEACWRRRGRCRAACAYSAVCLACRAPWCRGGSDSAVQSIPIARLACPMAAIPQKSRQATRCRKHGTADVPAGTDSPARRATTCGALQSVRRASGWINMIHSLAAGAGDRQRFPGGQRYALSKGRGPDAGSSIAMFGKCFN